MPRRRYAIAPPAFLIPPDPLHVGVIQRILGGERHLRVVRKRQLPGDVVRLKHGHREFGKSAWAASEAGLIRTVQNGDSRNIRSRSSRRTRRSRALDNTRWAAECPEITLDLPAGGEAIASFALLAGESVDDLRRTAKQLRGRTALDWLNETRNYAESRYGKLSIPSGGFYEEGVVRLVEECRSARNPHQ